MPLTAKQQWTLVGAGLVAHADDRLEVSEWDQAVALLEEDIPEDEMGPWMERLTSREQVESAFSELPDLPESDHADVLYRCWQMALADGRISDMEESAHDRIGHKLGRTTAEVEEWRAQWTGEAALRGELAVGIAAVLANVDGRLDPAEAAVFADLLERTPVPVNRRLDLGEQLHMPPDLDAVVEALSKLRPSDRLTALRAVAPMVRSSSRGDREREVFLDIAKKLGVDPAAAQVLL